MLLVSARPGSSSLPARARSRGEPNRTLTDPGGVCLATQVTTTIEFQYRTGIRRRLFQNARLRGSWDVAGRHSDTWTDRPMREVIGDDGCPMFTASVELALADAARTFRWGVVLDALDEDVGKDVWGIATELGDPGSTERYREFRLLPPGAAQVERYHLTWCRRLGAHKVLSGDAGRPGLRFRVWAP